MKHQATLKDTRSRRTLVYTGAAAACFGLLVLSLMLGSTSIPVRDVLRVLGGKLLHQPGWLEGVGGAQQTIVWSIRLPRTLLALMVGGALAVSGATMQAIFSNPLADSHMLGVSSGAGLGVALALVLGISFQGSVMACAFAGAVAAALLVWGIARFRAKSSVVSLLLAGVALSTMLSAATTLVMTLARAQIEQVYLWTMGSLASRGWGHVAWSAGGIALGTLGCIALGRPLNVLMLGHDTARSLGVSPERVRRLAMFFSVMATACAVSVSGIIGFVGLIAPHAVRALTGPDCRRVLPLSFLLGGSFLLLADTLARTLAPGLELPVGVLTAIAGGPFFIYLIKRKGVA
nr:iron ABC transporter permease [bacterium]